jgi:hypothetical protein
MGDGLADWREVLKHPALNLQNRYRNEIEQKIRSIQGNFGTGHALPTTNNALLKRLLDLCPCLFTQIDVKATSRAIVHLCEIKMGERIISSNVERAFNIQNPNDTAITFTHAPLQSEVAGGNVMEALCSEILTNCGVPHMDTDEDGWPVWKAPAHVSLNSGKMTEVKLYGDILIPSGPTNILISVKSQATRERLLVSGNRIESIAFGFFNSADEFWTKSRMNLYKRMGFTALYMPRSTMDTILNKLEQNGTVQYAVNVNGTKLYRPLEDFGPDMLRVAGKITLAL